MKIENVEKQVLQVSKDCLVLIDINKDRAVIILKDTLKDECSEVSIEFADLDDFVFFKNKIKRAYTKYVSACSRKKQRQKRKSAKHK